VRYRIVFKTIGNPELRFDRDSYFDEPVVDLMTFKYSYSAFSERFPNQDYFKNGGTIDDYTLVADLEHSDLEIYLDNNSITIGTYIFIDDEIIKINTNLGDGRYSCSRGQYGTRRANHVFNPSFSSGIRCFTGARWSPIGLEADIYDAEDKLVRKVYISDLKSVGAGVLITFESIIKKLKNNIFLNSVKSKLTIDKLITDYNIFGFNDFLDMQVSSNVKNGYLKLDDYDETGYFTINLKDVFESILSANMSFLIFDNGVFKVRKLLGLSVFNTFNVTTLTNKVLFGGSWVSDFKINLAGCLLNFSYISKTENNINEYEDSVVKSSGSTTGGAISGSMADIDTTNIVFNTYPTRALTVAREIGREYVETFSNIVGELSIDTTRYKGDGSGARPFKPNKYYKSDELNTELFTLFTINTDVVMYCLGISGNKVKFVLLDVVAHKPVGLAMIMKSTVAGSDTLALTSGEIASTFLYTSEKDLNLASHFLYDYLFIDRYLSIYDYNNTLIGVFEIINVTATEIQLFGYSAIDDKEVVVTYADNTQGDIGSGHLHLNLAGEIV